LLLYGNNLQTGRTARDKLSIQAVLYNRLSRGATTFSTYSLETINNANNGMTNLALANIAINNIGGLALVKVGLFLAKFI